MKSIGIASVTILAALSLGAQQGPPPNIPPVVPEATTTATTDATTTDATTTDATTTEVTTTAPAPPPPAPESALAAAAKRASAARGTTKSKISITNASLVKSGGHVTMAVDKTGAPLSVHAAESKEKAPGKKGAAADKKAVVEKDLKKPGDASATKVGPAATTPESEALDAAGDAAPGEYPATTATQPSTVQARQPQQATPAKPPL